MNRRAFVTGLGAVLAAATAARAQQAGNVPRVGILLPGFRPSPERIARGPFIVPMRELGWVDGRSVVFERRYANERPELLPMLARELIASRVDVIVTSSTPATRAAKEATATIPIVFSEVSQPLSQGFAASLTRPGGNVTGIADVSLELMPSQRQRMPVISQYVLPSPRKLPAVTVITFPARSFSPCFPRYIPAIAPRPGT